MLNIEVGTTDHLDPEVQAMLLAMYSRSYAPIAGRLPDSEESTLQHKEKLGKFYVQWGHKSVGQLGSTTVWLEGVSQLAAKAIENTPLFNGQESSTRYIDYSDQPMISNHEEITVWQEKFRALYIEALDLVIEKIEKEYPLAKQVNFDVKSGNVLLVNGKAEYSVVNEDKKYIFKTLNGDSDIGNLLLSFDSISEALDFFQTMFEEKIKPIWKNTIKARAFDICRGILPAGCTTNVGFTGTFDTLNDHFGEMLHHPSEEMRGLAFEVIEKMGAKYPYGTMDTDKLRERFSYVTKDYFYQEPSKLNTEALFFLNSEHSFPDEKVLTFLKDREKFQKLDRVSSSKIRMIYRNLLDFGSYRDLHRHRPGTIDMCILSPNYGFHSFYSSSLPKEMFDKLDELLNSYHEWYNREDNLISDVDKQYCTPMGYCIPVSYNCDLNQALYMMELRTGKTVHQTLRIFMQYWVNSFIEFVGEQVKIHVDMDEDNFTLKRGLQTIVEDKDGSPPPVYELKEKEQPLVEMSDGEVLKFKTLMDQVVSSFGPTDDGRLRMSISYSDKADELISLLNQKNIRTATEDLDEGHETFAYVLIPESDIDKFLYIYQLVSEQEKQSA